MLAVREIQYPQARNIGCARLATASRPVESATAKLWLALGIPTEPTAVAVGDVEHAEQRVERRGKILRPYECEIVSGTVILGKLAVGRAHQAADRQVEAGRAVLTLVISIRREIDDLVRLSGVLQEMDSAAINGRIASTAAFVREPAGIADTGNHEPVANARGNFLITRQPRDRADATGHEDDPHRVPARPSRQRFGREGRDHDAGEIVVAQCRVAYVSGEENLDRGFARKEAFAIGQASILEARIDPHFVVAIFE